jgi:pyruvate,orthophosphate dikinase
MRDLLGGKGANLAEMTSLGIPVPPGFTITTEVCDYFYKHGRSYPPQLDAQIDEALCLLESRMGAKLGDSDSPLLVSVRSGAARSMPGMMDTVLNLGLNDRTVQGLIKKSGNPRFAWDAYRRFINMFGDVVMGIAHERFEHAMEAAKHRNGLDSHAADTNLDAGDLEQLVESYKAVYREATNEEFPEDPRDQLRKSINAVFGSWNNDRAVRYRQLNRITGLIGTAVNVQAMVFGNMGETSGTGVAFTRDPSTGENKFYGEYLVNAQGEDVVAGIRTPEPIDRLEKEMPKAFAQLLEIRDRLEKHYQDMQDVEFTVQDGTLFMLQTRGGQRTGLSAVRIACEMHDEGLIDEKTAVGRVQPNQLDQLLHDVFDPAAKQKAVDAGRVIGKGLPASPGAASGKVVFTAEEAEQWAARGEPVILCRVETSPEDIGGMAVARGILTARGGMTSHAAVVARGMGRCCVAGCTGMQIEYGERRMHAAGRTIKQGESISIDGSTGEVIEGQLEAHPSEVVQVLVHGTLQPDEAPIYRQFMRLMQWADRYRTLKIRTNADTPEDSRRARRFGAEGIGLCRTEHMFFEDDRITPMREMILADDEPSRRAALTKLLPFQRKDFEGIFRAMDGLPVTIRLLDPPLHEFLPQQKDVQDRLAKDLGVSADKIRDRVDQLHEMNPMLGLRGCRLGITYPEVYDMQVRAIIEAACACRKEGIKAQPEIMIPLVGSATELSFLRERTERIAAEVIDETGVDVEYQIGTMIEVPRAALCADRIADHAEFFSFGTNDLTQMTFGFSRDDVAPLINRYVIQGVLPTDPFQTLDTAGVGQLIKLGVERGRATRPDLKVGICGEHGGDPDSVVFCHQIGMNYVSCSPFRVPIARLAAAQAALKGNA